MPEIRGKCGTDCSTCGFRERFSCKGCPEQQGEVFWGRCDTFRCATDRGCAHCGQCHELPCANLLDMIKNGHNPDRLTNLNRWKNEHT